MTTAAEAGHAAEIEAKVRRKAHLVQKLLDSPYIPILPTPKQWAFITDERKEVLYGGGAGSAKSVSLLASALLHVDDPSYNALILRRTYGDLILPGALMDVASDWLGGTRATSRRGGREWKFPSGSSVSFGYLATDAHKYRYQGAAFSGLFVDEVQQIELSSYRYLFSRLRRPANSSTPMRARATANPGGLPWVKSRFVDAHDATDRGFIPATMADNPFLDQIAYREMLAELDPVTREQLEHGDWNIQPSGNFYVVTGFNYIDPSYARKPASFRVRAWDLASTSGGGDYSAGVLVAFDADALRWRVEDCVRGQFGPDELERVMLATARRDPERTRVCVEQEPGSSGKLAVRDIGRRVLAGFDVVARRATGPKTERARLSASLLANGNMDLVQGSWCHDFVDELTAFPTGPHDDQVDAFAGAVNEVSRLMGTESTADTSAVDTFRRMSVVTSDAARSTGPVRSGIPGLNPPSSSPFGAGGFRR